MTLLTTVVACLRWRTGVVGTIAGEVTGFAATAALDIVRWTRLWTIRWLVARLLTIAASEAVDTFLLAVASAMANLIANVAANFDAAGDLSAVLLTVLLDMAHFTAVLALGDETVMRKTATLKTLKVLLWSGRPSLGELAGTRLSAPVEREYVLLIDDAGEADDCHSVGNLTLLWKVRVVIRGTWEVSIPWQ
jgi:hypothetical protein